MVYITTQIDFQWGKLMHNMISVIWTWLSVEKDCDWLELLGVIAAMKTEYIFLL